VHEYCFDVKEPRRNTVTKIHCTIHTPTANFKYNAELFFHVENKHTVDDNKFKETLNFEFTAEKWLRHRF